MRPYSQGAKSRDLPVNLSPQVRAGDNLKTAKRLALSISGDLLTLADESDQ